MHFGDYLTIFFLLGNIILIIILMGIYGKNYRSYKTNFALGLLLFTVFLFFHNLLDILSVIYYGDITQNINNAVENMYIFVALFEFIALSILLKVTWK